MAAHGVPAVAAINAFEEDTEEELRYVQERASGAVGAAVTRHYAEGGMGAEGLADPSLKGRAAGFVVALRSGIQLMPGLPTRPAGEQMDLDPRTEDIRGLT